MELYSADPAYLISGVYILQVSFCSWVNSHNSYTDLQLYEKVEKVPAAAEKCNIFALNYAKDMVEMAHLFAEKKPLQIVYSSLD